MRHLIAHAAQLGVSVHVAHLPAPYRGFYDSARKIVVYGFDLTPIERKCVLAHELGHAFYDHQCQGDQRAEELADAYAAALLIDPAEYAAAERICRSAVEIADELEVELAMVSAFQRRLTRIGGVTYVHSRMGTGQYRHSWVG